MTTSSTGVPLPGQHLPQQPDPVDPASIRAEVAELLSELTGSAAGRPIQYRAKVLDQAHDVLVRALGTVDKI